MVATSNLSGMAALELGESGCVYNIIRFEGRRLKAAPERWQRERGTRRWI